MRWIREAIRRNPLSHEGTEWVHVAILEAKVRRERSPGAPFTPLIPLPADFEAGTQVTILDAKRRVSEIKHAIQYQLRERMKFVKPHDPYVADLLFTLSFLGMAAVVVPTLWLAWRRRSNFLWLFAIAWGAPILAALLRTMGNLHVIEWNFWLDNSTVLSMAAEALFSSLAIAYRIKLLSIERDEAILGEELARRLADLDPLTGLLNRRSFLEKAIGREGEQVLQIADLDHFKSVNDTLGHDGGDEVLRLFARMLRTAAPASALVARIGGEEFAILCNAHEAIEPEILLARLRATRMPFDLQVTSSIGSCAGPLATEREWKALYRGADSALFEAKSAGRDRARHAPTRAAA